MKKIVSLLLLINQDPLTRIDGPLTALVVEYLFLISVAKQNFTINILNYKWYEK